MKKIFTITFLIIFFSILITGCDTESMVDDGTIKNTEWESTDKTVEITDEPKAAVINETINFLLKYHTDKSGNETMLYINEENQLVLYDLIGAKKIYTYNMGEDNRNIINSRLLSFNEQGLSLYIETAKKQSVDTSVEGLQVSNIDANSQKGEIVCLDSQLNHKETYDLTELFPEENGMYEYYGICMSIDASKLIMYGEKTIYFYSMESGKQTQIDTEIMKQLQDITITEMAISSDENKIAFLGWELNRDEKDVYGVIDLSKKTVTKKDTVNSYGNALHRSGDIVYITDGEIPGKKSATGAIICMNLADGTISELKVDNLESTTATLLENQNDMVTASAVSSEDKDIEGWKFRLYDFNTGREKGQKEVKCSGSLLGLMSAGDRILAVIYQEDGSYNLYRFNL